MGKRGADDHEEYDDGYNCCCFYVLNVCDCAFSINFLCLKEIVHNYLQKVRKGNYI